MRNLCRVGDLSVDEQMAIYALARELKSSKQRENFENFREADTQHVFYLLFLEDSTRTKESFRAAAEFLGGKVRIFDCSTSSFNKNETITDTVKMLAGYSMGPVTFVIRSRQEGLCRWLADAFSAISQNVHLRDSNPRPLVNFVNAGDGRHEHPTQELLDEFSFLEFHDFKRDTIHIALIGDLLNGRTVHSKVDGLRLFHHVQVDLVAPPELAMPLEYLERMRMAGYHVREFPSVQEYLEVPVDQQAPIWYFTRLQVERMTEFAKSQLPQLRQATTFQEAWTHKLPRGCRFFHPLPRYGLEPEIPFALDHTVLNGWDAQSRNGYFVRIALLQWLSGRKDSSAGDTLHCEETTPKLRCSNADCVSNTEPHHQVASCFVAQPRNAGCFACRYCEKIFCLA